MTLESTGPKSLLEDEMAVRWAFLEDESNPCIVVNSHMEFIYLNEPGRSLISSKWFGKRCFELLPTQNESCAWGCPTIRDVNETDVIKFQEELLITESGEPITLGVAVVPLEGISGDGAAALLLMRRKEPIAEDTAFQDALLGEAETLRGRITSLFH